MKIEHECWMVWFRDGWTQRGRWVAWEGSGSLTRRNAIAWAKGNTIVGFDGGWRNCRRRGLVKCLRTTISAEVPDE